MVIIKETLKEGEEVSGALTGGLWNTKDCVVTNINN